MTNETKKVRVVRGTYYDRENGRFVGNNCDVKVSEVEVEIIDRAPWKFEAPEGGTLEAVGSGGSESESGDESDEDDEADAEAEDFDIDGFLDRTWNAVVSDVNSGAYDEFLDALLEAERSDRQRSSVIEAIEDRQSGV